MAAVLLGTLALALSGCLPQVDFSRLTQEQEARAKLFAAEQLWVNAKVTLADVLTDLVVDHNVALPAAVKAALRIARDAGDAALAAAAMALAGGDLGGFTKALQDLAQATTSLAGETRRLL
jgi:hypothetical protein